MTKLGVSYYIQQRDLLEEILQEEGGAGALITKLNEARSATERVIAVYPSHSGNDELYGKLGWVSDDIRRLVEDVKRDGVFEIPTTSRRWCMLVKVACAMKGKNPREYDV